MATWWTGVYRWHSSLCHQHTPVHQYDCGYCQAVSVYARWAHGGQVWTGVYRWHSSLCHQHTPVHQYDCGYFQAVSVYARWPHGGQVCTGDTVLCVISTHLYTNMTVVTSRLSLCMLDGHMVDRCVQVTQFSVSSAHTCPPIWLWLPPGCLCVC